MERRRTIVSAAVVAIACGTLAEGDQSSQSTSATGSTTEATSSEGSGEDETSLPGTAETTDPTTTSDTTDPAPLCGNGVLDVGEVCDDGNDLDGDGCNVDCRPSGELVFELVFNPTPVGNEAIRDIDHAEDGTYVVGGYITSMGVDAWAARLTQDDTVLWDLPVFAGPIDDLVFGVAAGEGGKTFAAGVVDETAATGDPWIGALSPAGVVDVADRIGLAPYGRFFEVANAGDGIVVVGHQEDVSGSHGIVRLYGYDLVLQAEIEPVVATTGLVMRDACPSAEDLFTVGQRQNGTAAVEGLAAMLDTGTLEWLRVTQAQAGQTSIALACAVAGEGGDRRLWAAGYDTAATPRWLAWLKAYAVDGTTAIDVPTYVGEDDLGAFWSDVASDAAGNVIVVGATVVGAAEHEYTPVVRKLDPDGATLWTRVLVPGGFPLGSADAVDVSPEGAIRIVGWGSDAVGLRRRWLARLTP